MKKTPSNKRTPGGGKSTGQQRTGDGKSTGQKRTGDGKKPGHPPAGRKGNDAGKSAGSEKRDPRKSAGRAGGRQKSGNAGRGPGSRHISGDTSRGPGGRRADSRGGGPAKPAPRGIRLNRYIANAGICSRREADDLITAGLVSLNGKVVSELGTRVMPGDDVRYNGRRIKSERKVYLLLNKPKDFVTTTDDPKERKTVMQLVGKACPERIYPVGRLDRQTTGVLLFTNDGDLAKRLTHPSHNKKKIYHVFLDRVVSAGDLEKLAGGVTLDDGFIQPDAISYANPENRREIGLEIHSGRNRVVRRMFEHLDYKVTRLDRVYFAGLTKKKLPRGKWRFLSEKEVNRLKMNAYE